MPAAVPQDIQDKFDALLKSFELTHPGWCLVFNVNDQTYAIGRTNKEASEAYDKAYGEVTKDTRPVRDFMSNTVLFTRAAVKPGVYKHFKGNIYHVLGVSEHTETHELSVVYIPQHGPHADKLSNRPLRMFLEDVENNAEAPDYKGPRFTLIEEKKFVIDKEMEGWVADLLREAAKT